MYVFEESFHKTHFKYFILTKTERNATLVVFVFQHKLDVIVTPVEYFEMSPVAWAPEHWDDMKRVAPIFALVRDNYNLK